MRPIKRWVRGLLHFAKLPIGFVVYLISNKTPAFAYQSMIGLFCLTKGCSNDFISRVISFFDPPCDLSSPIGILGNMTDKKQLSFITNTLREQGYYVFQDKLPSDLCDQLLKYATSSPCTMRPMDGDGLGKPVDTIYHRHAPQATRYDFETQDLLHNLDVQKILADMSFVAVAQDYLGTKPVIDVLSMWWHTNFSNAPDSAAAQYFHFDMDRPKWIKFFIYLTDVETTNGPHSFVAGSHKTGAIPSNLLQKGYARLTDEEVAMNFNKKDVIEFNAPRGTIIAEDTRGLHKGKHVTEGDRLVLQIQFSNSLFGSYYPKVCLSDEMCEELKVNVARYPWLYAAYI